MENITLEEMENELEAVRKKTYKKDGDPRADATEENLARFAELGQQIAAEKEYMNSDDDEEKKPTDVDPSTDTSTDAQKIADLTEELRREKLITQAYKAPKGVGVNNRFRPDGENVRIDEAMLPALAEAERLPVSIPEALKEGLIDEAKALNMTKAVERRIRCYVKRAGSHEDPRSHKVTEWDGGYRKGIKPEDLTKAEFWLKKIGRVDAKGKGDPKWDTSIVIPNMDNI